MRTEKNRAPVLLVDMDNTSYDFNLAVSNELKTRRLTAPPERVYTDYFHDSFPFVTLEMVQEITSTVSFFRDIPLISGARDGLLQVMDAGIKVVFCSRPVQWSDTCADQKRDAIERDFGLGFAESAYIDLDKQSQPGDILLDDKIVAVDTQKPPEWSQAVYDQLWNRENGLFLPRMEGWSQHSVTRLVSLVLEKYESTA